MSSFRKAILTLALLATAGVAVAQSGKYPGIGRAATHKEVKAWDIDVRPDFKGLPKGSGSVAQGQDILTVGKFEMPARAYLGRFNF